MAFFDSLKNVVKAPFSPFGVIGEAAGGLFKNPSKSANKYLDQIQGTISPYYQPYIQAGNKALPTLQEQFENLINNPTGFMQSIGGNFQQSPGYQWNFNQAINAAENAAAAGGMAGTPQHQQQAATVASGLANQDYYNFLDHALNMYMGGLSGLGGINQMGFGASTGLADDLASVLMNKAQLGYTGAQNRGEGIGALLGAAASALPFFF